MVIIRWRLFWLVSKWFGFQISDLILNPDHLKTNLYLTIRNPDMSGFQIPTALDFFLPNNQKARVTLFVRPFEYRCPIQTIIQFPVHYSDDSSSYYPISNWM